MVEKSCHSPFSIVCPVNTWNDLAKPLCVTGIPAYSGTAIEELIPGTISKGIEYLAISSISSPPLPKTKGSPPFTLATTFPSKAFLANVLFISSWITPPSVFPLPKYIISALALASFNTFESINLSYITQSASSIHLFPFKVKRSIFPQPAPIM